MIDGPNFPLKHDKYGFVSEIIWKQFSLGVLQRSLANDLHMEKVKNRSHWIFYSNLIFYKSILNSEIVFFYQCISWLWLYDKHVANLKTSSS